jgi:hypothetical protein
MSRFINFIKYNNSVSIGLGLLFLSFGGALAASPDLRAGVADAFVQESQNVVSVDNSYIVNINLDTYVPRVQVTSVTEDDEHYYVDYQLQTIGLQNGVWQDLYQTSSMEVPKEALRGRDLGLYITDQLKDVIGRQVSLLRETQKFERSVGQTQKVVATAYSGLVGKFLDATEETIPGYQPVIPDPVPVVAAAGSASVTQPSSSVSSQQSTANTSGDVTPPVITVVGNNPATIARNASYVDLGATIFDAVSPNIGIVYAVDGVEVPTININTSIDHTYTITYSATDQAGNTGSATRTIIVGTGTVATTTPTITSTSTTTTQTGETTTSVSTTTQTSATSTPQ